MKTKENIDVCGAIIKVESLVTLTTNIADHTVVAEANKPYSNYYGTAPFNMPVKPNSLFLFTVPYYSLEEVLRFAQLIDLCCTQNLNIAVSVLDLGSEHYPAIRIKNFPDYAMLSKLQECFREQGVQFAEKVHVRNSAVIRTNKCFSFDAIAENIYLDHEQKKTGYVALSKLMNYENFKAVLANIRNNTDCPLFDAARGAIIREGKVIDIVRIFSENIGIELLECIQKKFEENLLK